MYASFRDGKDYNVSRHLIQNFAQSLVNCIFFAKIQLPRFANFYLNFWTVAQFVGSVQCKIVGGAFVPLLFFAMHNMFKEARAVDTHIHIFRWCFSNFHYYYVIVGSVISLYDLSCPSVCWLVVLTVIISINNGGSNTSMLLSELLFTKNLLFQNGMTLTWRETFYFFYNLFGNVFVSLRYIKSQNKI